MTNVQPEAERWKDGGTASAKRTQGSDQAVGSLASYIPKGGGKQRPLGIPALEDKIVQLAAARILESIFEADFSERSVGYRRGKPGPRQSSYQLGRELYGGTYRWIVEADIASFFDEVDHDWLMRMIEQRVKDRAFTGLIRKWLKAGVLEPGEENPWSPVRGTPQGGIISPVLANIYLHYVLDLWIEKKLSREYRGEVIFMRYADDIIVGFERKTSKKKYRASLRAMKDWLEKARSWPLKMILSSLRRRLRGYWNYYCVKGNSQMTWKYYRAVTELTFKWLNRRSQRKSFTWKRFGKLWGGAWQIPRPRVVEHVTRTEQGEFVLAPAAPTR